MGRLVFIILILTGCSCSTKIHQSFIYNKYIPDATYHVLNDSLQVYHRSLGDFDYQSNAKQLKKQLRKQTLNNVLVYGKTNLEPFYEYYLLYNPDKDKVDFSVFEYVLDTTIKNNNYLFLGRGIDGEFPINDFKFIAKSIKVEKDYRSDIISLNDVLKRNYNITKYLAAYNQIEQYPAENEFDKWFKLQFELTYLSMMGNSNLYEEKLKEFEGNYDLKLSL